MLNIFFNSNILWHFMNSPPERTTHIDDHTLIQQALFLCSHDKVVRVVPVIDDVFQINPCTKDK